MPVKLLVVEDEKSILKLLRTILTANKYEVVEASTGAEALSLITSHCPDLILLDLGLPDMDGNTLLSSVRKWTSTPVIVLSARTHESDKVEAIDLGADDYITKPFGASELLARIRMALRHTLSLIHISEPTRQAEISYAVFCLKKKIIHIYEPTRQAGEISVLITDIVQH